MSESRKVMISAAKNGGFGVWGEEYDINVDARHFRGRSEGLLFAGSLGDCLQYIARHMLPEQMVAPSHD